MITLEKIQILLWLIIFTGAPLFSELRFEPGQLTLPPREGSELVETVTVFNNDSRELILHLIPSGEGFTVTPGELHIEALGSGIFTVQGIVDHPGEALALLMLSDREDVPYMYSILPASGTPSSEYETDNSGHNNNAGIEPFYFFYSPGCEICDVFYSRDLPELEEELSLVLQPDKKNVFETDNFELLETLAAERGTSIRDFPILIAGDRMFSGEQGVREVFPELLREDRTAFSSGDKKAGPGFEDVLPGLRWLPVFLAGLLDGINPCAFTSLIFLISYLRLMKKKGSEILKIGGSFTIAVFLTYFFIGLGAFRFIRMADSFTIISSVIRYVLGGTMLILASLTLFDYSRIRQGRASDSLLQLSAGTKKRIHRVVRQSSRSSLIYVSSFAAGFLISVYELGCTGQIYLPMLVYMVRQKSWSALGPLLLYNIAFILPLILVFTLFYRGSDSDKISAFFQKRLGLIKLASAALFLIMGLLVLLF